MAEYCFLVHLVGSSSFVLQINLLLQENDVIRRMLQTTRGLFWTGLMILTRGQMTKTTPELAPFLSFRLTGDFMFTRPAYTVDHRKIACRTWNPPVPTPRPYHQVTADLFF
ncbi:hypothetical protein AVEN_227448-1 [Araneus ventricosus]|uniref:Uncharacterized protein n=1 Tax=Araneus ventricosus TaxID=182803 RepID=A0A4Y2TS86_ARAVE|nr:hypothetical protein AVEN_227448-1 [Araneus ventricosus]